MAAPNRANDPRRQSKIVWQKGMLTKDELEEQASKMFGKYGSEVESERARQAEHERESRGNN